MYSWATSILTVVAAVATTTPASAPCGSAATVEEADLLLPGCLTTPRHLPSLNLTITQ
jgi:hypothetical protein